MTIVVQNRYFIQAGKEDEALGVRRIASEVRRKSGQPVGRIMRTLEPDETMPTFIWECEYPDLAARETDAAWADASAEFEAVRSRMRTLYDRFERIVHEVVDE